MRIRVSKAEKLAIIRAAIDYEQSLLDSLAHLAKDPEWKEEIDGTRARIQRYIAIARSWEGA